MSVVHERARGGNRGAWEVLSSHPHPLAQALVADLLWSGVGDWLAADKPRARELAMQALPWMREQAAADSAYACRPMGLALAVLSVTGGA